MTKHSSQAPSITYKDAGVDIDAGNALVERIKHVAKATRRPEVMAGLGGFSALFKLPLAKYRQPVLVAGTDGVGTKLRLAIDLNRHSGIGIDLVAMCANDLLVGGAEPLFFLDYYATGKLDVETAAAVVASIGEGCQQAGMSLVGGETAEMPGMYAADDYDLAGFCVGIVEEDAIIDGQQVKPGHRLIGLASSGPHANGYSLIRKLLEHSQADLHAKFDGDASLADVLLAPTRIYVASVHQLLTKHPIHAMSHITGGGFQENLPRVLPADCQAIVDTQAWPRPKIFDWLQQQGNLSQDQLYRTFNCGIGLILCVPETDSPAVLDALAELGEQAWDIGHIAASDSTAEPVVLV